MKYCACRGAKNRDAGRWAAVAFGGMVNLD